MIRITRLDEQGVPTLRVEGDLDREAVDLVRQECQLCARKGAADRPLRLDLGGLRHADPVGLELLREMKAHPGIELVDCPPLWRTIINGVPK